MNSWGWMMIVWALISIGVLGLIAWFAVQRTQTSLQGRSPSEPSAKAARQMLDERLARGEIDLDEYERRADALDRHTPVGV